MNVRYLHGFRYFPSTLYHHGCSGCHGIQPYFLECSSRIFIWLPSRTDMSKRVDCMLNILRTCLYWNIKPKTSQSVFRIYEKPSCGGINHSPILFSFPIHRSNFLFCSPKEANIHGFLMNMYGHLIMLNSTRIR